METQMVGSDKDKVCLIFSSDKRFWSKTDPMLFLDSGCIRYSQLTDLNGRDIVAFDPTEEVLKRFETANIYLRGVQNRIKNELINDLNSIHGVKYDSKSWEILIGWWLKRYIAYQYYKYNRIRDIREQYDIYCIAPKIVTYPEIRSTLHAFKLFSESDLYNTLVGIRIANWLGVEIHKDVLVPDDQIDEIRFVNGDSGSLGICIIHRILSFLSKAGKAINYEFDIHLNFFELAKLIASGKMKCVAKACLPSVNDISFQEKTRVNILSSYKTQDDFERMLCEFISKDIPVVYVEGFSRLRDIGKEYFGVNKKAFYSHDAWYTDEVCKSYLAAERLNGLKIYGISHGGTAVNKEDISTFDTGCVDCYYTWGWNKKITDCDVKPMPSIKLSSEIKGTKSLANPSDEILYVGNAFPRYVMEYRYKYSSIPSRYVDDQIHIIMSMHNKGIKYRARLYPDYYGWDLKERLLSQIGDCRIETGKTPFLFSLQNSRLCVFDIVMTSWTEAYALGKPVMFIVPEYYEYYNEDLMKDIEGLKQVGIFHNSIDDAIDYLKIIEDNIEEWWMEPLRQHVIRAFASQYALSSEDYKAEWYNEIVNSHDGEAR